MGLPHGARSGSRLCNLMARSFPRWLSRIAPHNCGTLGKLLPVFPCSQVFEPVMAFGRNADSGRILGHVVGTRPTYPLHRNQAFALKPKNLFNYLGLRTVGGTPA